MSITQSGGAPGSLAGLIAARLPALSEASASVFAHRSTRLCIKSAVGTNTHSQRWSIARGEVFARRMAEEAGRGGRRRRWVEERVGGRKIKFGEVPVVITAGEIDMFL